MGKENINAAKGQLYKLDETPRMSSSFRASAATLNDNPHPIYCYLSGGMSEKEDKTATLCCYKCFETQQNKECTEDYGNV